MLTCLLAVTFSLFLVLSLVSSLAFHSFSAFGHSPYPPHYLEITEIRNYDYDTTFMGDYHPDQQPIKVVSAGNRFVINSLVTNKNHTEEHFDLITEIFDRNATCVYLNIRYGVAVPLGRQVPIDSGMTPIVLTQPGAYLVKVFVWRNTDEAPDALSHAQVRFLEVTT